MRIAVLVGSKGRGSNMAAILHAGKSGELPIEWAVVVVPSESVPAAEIARQLEATVVVIDPTRESFGEELLELFEREHIDLICLAGFTRLLPIEVVQRYKGKILNIHPALLPKFGGKGMYGMRVHEAVIDSGEKQSGCTVHFVTENYDEGEILLQKKCEVKPDDTPESLALRVLALEHECYVEAIRLWAQVHIA